MEAEKLKLNKEVSDFLDNMDHPKRPEIEQLRRDILSANERLDENIKWNGPNYSVHGEDRITMKIHPPKQIQLVFHRGAKVLEQPPKQLINDDSEMLSWRTNDRAIASFKDLKDILSKESALRNIVNDWINATCKE